MLCCSRGPTDLLRRRRPRAPRPSSNVGSRSSNRRPSNSGWRMRPSERQAQQDTQKLYDEYSDEAWQEILGTTAEQWQKIKPETGKSQEGPRHAGTSAFGLCFQRGRQLRVQQRQPQFRRGRRDGDEQCSLFPAGAAVLRRAEVPPAVVVAAAVGTTQGAPSGSAGSGGGGSYRGSVAGGQGESSASGGGATSGSGYGFSIGGTGPAKKKIGKVSLGWQWQRPSLKKSPAQLSGNEKACEQLLDAVDAKSPDPAAGPSAVGSSTARSGRKWRRNARRPADSSAKSSPPNRKRN